MNDEIDYEALPESFSTATHLFAGALAGITEHTVMYPLDFLKTRMQILTTQGTSASGVYAGVIQTATKVGTTEGWRAFWRGVSSVVVGAGPSHALYFAVYEQFKHLFGATGDGHYPFATAAAGAVATTCSEAFMNPFDVIKQRMQIHGMVYRNMSACALAVYRKEGFSAFYLSYPTTLAMSIPYHSINFSVYESMRKWMNPTGRYDPMTHIVAGAVAGAAAAALTNPIDVVKTLLQTKGESDIPAVQKVQGFRDASRIIYQTAGWKGFFKGSTPRIMATMPSTAICWATYEYFKYIIS